MSTLFFALRELVLGQLCVDSAWTAPRANSLCQLLLFSLAKLTSTVRTVFPRPNVLVWLVFPLGFILLRNEGFLVDHLYCFLFACSFVNKIHMVLQHTYTHFHTNELSVSIHAWTSHPYLIILNSRISCHAITKSFYSFSNNTQTHHHNKLHALKYVYIHRNNWGPVLAW